MAHVEDVPKLAKRQRQERYRHRRLFILPESETRQDKGSEGRDGQGGAAVAASIYPYRLRP